MILFPGEMNGHVSVIILGTIAILSWRITKGLACGWGYREKKKRWESERLL